MFYRYEVKNNGKEDILYLYLTMNYEFSRELGLKASDKEMKRRCKNFIKNNGIDFSGNKVYLVIDGIVVKTLDINKEEEIEVLKENLYYSNDYYLVTVKLDSSAIVEMTLKDYLLGVLATNMIPGLNIEVLKAMCILYRTYAFKEMEEKKVIDATNNFAIYKPVSYYKLSFAPSYDGVIKNLEKAIDDTDCIFNTYNNYYILPFIHIANAGRTLSDTRYPYLSQVISLWDYTSPYFIETKKFSYNDLSRIFKMPIDSKTSVEIMEISPYGKLLKLKIGNTIIDGRNLLKKLNLKSLYINIIMNKENILFISMGWGEFLGLSMYGANELAKNGCDYANILKYYFPKTKLKKYIKELS